MKCLTSILAAGTTTFYAGYAFAQEALPQAGQGRGPRFGYDFQHMRGWGGGFMFHPFACLLMLLLLILLIGCLVRFFCHRRGWYGHGWRGYGWHGGNRDGGRALDILEERFARGEIDKNEFEEKRKLLGR